MKSLGRDNPPEESALMPEPAAAFVWLEFWRLWTGETFGYAEVEAYCRITGTRFASWEIEALRRMQGECLRWRADVGHSETRDRD